MRVIYGVLALVSLGCVAYIVMASTVRRLRRTLDDEEIDTLIRRPVVKFSGFDEDARTRSTQARAVATGAAAKRSGVTEPRRIAEVTDFADFRRGGT